MSRFKVSKENLPDYLKDALYCIEYLTPLRFDNAQDWRTKDQGWVIETYAIDDSVFEKREEIEQIIKMQFTHNPSTKCVEEDTSDFEELEYKGDKYFNIYLRTQESEISYVHQFRKN